MKESYEFRARKALHKEFGSNYVDRKVTPMQISQLWSFLAGIGPTPNQLAQLVNNGPVSKELLQTIFDKLNICDVV
ncbi:hypothetical protein [Pseudoalteromonas obscura]|uniref:Uncharacterized protein n=1 Tax=Pseudoalteromonas obscura TaxID=3048491 RepID=A0ABT7EH52_9GAMM|nr:hypothetical protein [Pseudoalteromonas sp. P94(2023)]MDK2594370.1 hypothetical protein [Pseudoalteromonas sp. P94(2023)]